MSHHLFLTGAVQVGKSTIISRVIKELDIPVSGFRTVAVFNECGESDIFLIPAGGTQEDCALASHLAHRIPGEKPVFHETVFLSRGVSLLEACSGPLVVMDELGWMESSCFLFQEAVFSVLNGPIPVLGVVRDCHIPFLDAVREHPAVDVLEVTRENRDVVLENVLQWARACC
ncbi:MAG TPA: hypothetical protein O0W91_01050 [Methanocorpusculum sp.]|nr:hypothetical protein [Methanocorpusculum sp.]